MPLGVWREAGNVALRPAAIAPRCLWQIHFDLARRRFGVCIHFVGTAPQTQVQIRFAAALAMHFLATTHPSCSLFLAVGRFCLISGADAVSATGADSARSADISAKRQT